MLDIKSLINSDEVKEISIKFPKENYVYVLKIHIIIIRVSIIIS